MKMTRSRKILGSIEVVLAVVVLVVAVALAPAYSAEKPAPETQAPTADASEAAATEPVPETTTLPAPELPEVNDYTVENYIVLTSDAAMEMYSIAQKRLTEYGQTLSKLKSCVPEINVYSLLAPTRIAFYGPEEYRTGSHDQTRGIEIAYSAMTGGVETVDAYSHIARHTDEYIYFRTDHHWTARGAYYAYEAFCETAGLTCKPLSAHETGRLDGFVGSMYRYTHSEKLKENPDYVEVFYPTVEASGQFYSSPAMTDGKNLRIISTSITDSSSKYMAFIQGDKPLIKMTSACGSDRKILMVKESYGNAFAPFLLENFSEVYVLDPRQDGVKGMNLPQFLRDHGITDVLVLNYLMAPSNSTFMNAFKAMLDA